MRESRRMDWGFEKKTWTIVHLSCQYCESSALNVCSLALTDSCLVGCLWDTSTKTYCIDINVKRNTLNILSNMNIILFCLTMEEESINRIMDRRKGLKLFCLALILCNIKMYKEMLQHAVQQTWVLKLKTCITPFPPMLSIRHYKIYHLDSCYPSWCQTLSYSLLRYLRKLLITPVPASSFDVGVTM